MLVNPKLSFDIDSITIKANMELSGKVIEKYPRNFFTIIVLWMVNQDLLIGILLFWSNVRHIETKERETSSQHQLKNFFLMK